MVATLVFSFGWVIYRLPLLRFSPDCCPRPSLFLDQHMRLSRRGVKGGVARLIPPPDPLALPVLKMVQTQPLTISAMEPVGNYAYSIRFSDGHDTGIFAFDLLRHLGQPPQTAP